MIKRFQHIAPAFAVHLATVLLTVVLLSSCNHKELYVENYDLFPVRVAFDFSKVESTPAIMRTYFYPINEDGIAGQPQIFDLRSEGDMVYLAAGDYHVVAYNSEAENILAEGEDIYSDFKLTTHKFNVNTQEVPQRTGHRVLERELFGTSVPFNEKESPDYWLSDTPDWTIASHVDRFRVESTPGADGEQARMLTLPVVEATVTLDIQVKGFQGLELATLMRGTLSGIPDGYQMSTGKAVQEPTMMSFLGKVDHERNVITGSIRLWGYLPTDNTVHQYLNIYIWGERGNYFLTEDITEQLNKASQTGDLTFTVDMTSDINFFDGTEGIGSSGFDPGVTEWGEYKVDISL